MVLIFNATWFFLERERVISQFVWLSKQKSEASHTLPDSKVHVANMGPTWVLSAPEWLYVGPMNLAIRDAFERVNTWRPEAWFTNNE